MKINEINLRDPFILLHNGTYYMYGSRGWDFTGFDVYTSSDLENWSEAKSVFEKPEDFWGTKEYWAPEVHEYKGKFYMFASFNSDSRRRGTQILVSDAPDGTFVVHSKNPITPPDMEALDGTLYIAKDGSPYMVFCHEWVQVKDGRMCAVKLKDDLSAPDGEPFVLFSASEYPNAPEGAESYVTDGPYFYRASNGRLLMIWSTYSNGEYAEAVCYSDNGEIDGNWIQCKEPLFDKDGGHGMLFVDKSGKLNFIMHSPNRPKFAERPVLKEVAETKDGFLRLK